MLDPRLKLQYYKDHSWEEKYIRNAKKQVTELWNSTYKSNTTEALEASADDIDTIYHGPKYPGYLANFRFRLILYLGVYKIFYYKCRVLKICSIFKKIFTCVAWVKLDSSNSIIKRKWEFISEKRREYYT